MEERHELIHFSGKMPAKIFMHRLGSVPKHWHQSIEILFVLNGEVNILVDDRSYRLKEADVIVINSQSVHELYSEGSELVAFQIKPAHLTPLKDYGDLFFDCCSAHDAEGAGYDHIKRLLARLLKANETGENLLLSQAIVLMLFNELIHNHLSSRPKPRASSHKSLQRIAAITAYVEAHYREGVSLSDIAEREHYSTSNLSRIFKEVMSVTFSAYYTELRLEYAVNEMLSSNDSIADIAVRNGFGDSRAFVSSFKKKYGVLPSDYRNSFRSYIPSEQLPNEINYLAIKSSRSLSTLARYLKADEHLPSLQSDAQKTRKRHIGPVDSAAVIKKLAHTNRSVCCVGSARDLLFEDVRGMLRKMQSEMPFSYVKFHGILSDDMMLYDELPGGKPVLSFVMLDKVLDFLLSLRLKPIMQLSFMPGALASDPSKTSFYMQYNTSPPKDMEKWRHLIRELTLHCIRRYGAEEVLSWPFCVWNEPDTPCDMFGFEKKESFFTFYKDTYDTVKAINADIRFGSPSLLFLPEDSMNWYGPFFDFCHENGCIPDFINLHYYADDLELLSHSNMSVRQKNKLCMDENALAHFLDAYDANAGRYHIEGIPVYMTEWNLTVNHRNLINDTCFKACYVAKNILENYDRLQSFGYWSLTDLLGEMQPDEQLFHGGLGLFTVNGIPKGQYHVLKMLHSLGSDFLGSGDGWFAAKTADTGEIQVMLYNYTHYNMLFSTGELFDVTSTDRYTSFSGMGACQVHLRLCGLPADQYLVTQVFVNREAGSAYDIWLKEGATEPLLPAQSELLYHHSQPGVHAHIAEPTDGELELRQLLAPLEVRLVQLRPR